MADNPKDTLLVLDEVATELAVSLFRSRYQNNKENFILKVRITNLPTSDNLRDLRQVHLNCLVKVRGVITRRSEVLPQIVSLSFDCLGCNTRLGPYIRDDQSQLAVEICPNCNKRGNFPLLPKQRLLHTSFFFVYFLIYLLILSFFYTYYFDLC